MTLTKFGLALLCATLCRAADDRVYALKSAMPMAQVSKTEDGNWRRERLLWRASAFTYVAANAFDYASSFAVRGTPGVYESNGLQADRNGQFAPGRAAAFKVGMTMGLLVPQYFLLRHHPKMARAFSYINFGASSVPVWAGAHNLTLMH